MHKIVVTEGIVLGKRGVGEANTAVVLLTHELGLIRASARSARYEKSKLRYGLEPLMRGRFSLVRGKYEWKLTGVTEQRKLFSHSITGGVGNQAIGRVIRLMLRLIQGEEPVPMLYTTVSEGFGFLADAQSATDAEAIECVLVLRTLSHLGYLPERPELTPFVTSSLFSIELAASAAKSRALLVRAINESLGATGL